MSLSPIPRPVRDFIVNCIDSVEELDALVLLFETAPRTWEFGEILQQLHSSTASIERRLQVLCSKKLIQCAGNRFSYVAAENQNHELLSRLVQAYRGGYKIRIIELIFSKPDERLRNFADAFKIRKED